VGQFAYSVVNFFRGASRLYAVLIMFIVPVLLFDVISTYFGLFEPTAYELNSIPRFFIEALGEEVGLSSFFVLVMFSYLIILRVIDAKGLYITEVGFAAIFGLRHVIAGISNLSIFFDGNWLKPLSDTMYVYWPFLLLIFFIIALTEFLLE